MAIKIPSINIRRLYTKEELALANEIRAKENRLEDLKNYKKILMLSEVKVYYKREPHNKTFEEFENSFHYEDKNGNKNRKKDNVEYLNKFIKKNINKINVKSYNKYCRKNEDMVDIRQKVKSYKIQLEVLINDCKGERKVKQFFKTDYVDLFKCELSDSFEIDNYEITEDIIIINVNHNKIFLDLLLNGFEYNGERYILYSASAGQLRKVKVMFVRDSKYKLSERRLTNGLSKKMINDLGGINITKWSAYLALSTSATKVWEDIDIDRVIVVDDFETVLKNRMVDNINSDFEINRIKKDVTIPHTDGFGMMIPSFCKDSRIIRAPWIKGLLAPFNFRKFISEYDGNCIIKDIYGVEHDVNEVDCILTKSQFKMHEYYESWDDYKDKFKKNKCAFRFMNAESKKDLRLKAKFNYQMWNTLELENTNDFVDYFLSNEKDKIITAHSEVHSMLDMFFVDKKIYDKNNNLQKALYLYPSLFKTDIFKKPLKDMITKRKNDMRQGRIKINGVYTFLFPDVFAWCEYLFLGIEEPIGLLNDGEVFCKLIKEEKEILVNRSPHLYLEHCVRKNKINELTKRWFLTKGIYTSTQDMISKQLFFDVDGDIALVADNDVLVETAKITMKDIVPLDFELAKGGKKEINANNIHDSYIKAFDVNIGEYSNMITKIMNSDNKDIGLVAKICWLNNVYIDYAKTGWCPEIPDELQDIIKELKNRKLPHFFIYAKDKEKNSVLEVNENSTVDNMVRYVDDMMLKDGKTKRIRYNYTKIKKFVLNNLLSQKSSNVKEDEGLIKLFEKMCRSRHSTAIRHNLRNLEESEKINEREYLSLELKKEVKEYLTQNEITKDDGADILIKYVFNNKKNKDMLFIIFGSTIVKRLEKRYERLLNGESIRCEICGDLVKKTNNKVIYCEKCAKVVAKRQKLESWHRNKGKNKPK